MAASRAAHLPHILGASRLNWIISSFLLFWYYHTGRPQMTRQARDEEEHLINYNLVISVLDNLFHGDRLFAYYLMTSLNPEEDNYCKGKRVWWFCQDTRSRTMWKPKKCVNKCCEYIYWDAATLLPSANLVYPSSHESTAELHKNKVVRQCPLGR